MTQLTGTIECELRRKLSHIHNNGTVMLHSITWWGFTHKDDSCNGICLTRYLISSITSLIHLVLNRSHLKIGRYIECKLLFGMKFAQLLLQQNYQQAHSGTVWMDIGQCRAYYILSVKHCTFHPYLILIIILAF